MAQHLPDAITGKKSTKSVFHNDLIKWSEEHSLNYKISRFGSFYVTDKNGDIWRISDHPTGKTHDIGMGHFDSEFDLSYYFTKNTMGEILSLDTQQLMDDLESCIINGEVL